MAARQLGLDSKTLYNILSTDKYARFESMRQVSKNMSSPAVVFYRESDGTVIDLGAQDIDELLHMELHRAGHLPGTQ